jgi:23S rRNA (cytosine1962-C5)-methyltransferase
MLKEFPFLKGIYLKAKTNDGEEGQILFGHLPEEIIFLENGIKFKTSLSKAAKTGFFLDQRDNRFMISKVSKNKKVANFFSYTGGFSLFAALGGCHEVHSIDIAPEAIKVCEEQFVLNNFNVKRENICGDAFEWLAKYDKQKHFFDLVIIDPPSFAPNQKSKENALKAYEKCFSLGAKIVAPNGMIAFSSCSAHVTQGDFQSVLQNSLAMAKRQGQVLYQGGSPLDHPYPLAMPELNYLKFSLLALN